MRNVFKKDWFIMLSSLLISVALWVYVSYNVNPDYEKEIRNIPITFTNMSTDFDSGKLHIIEQNAKTLSVELKGDRKTIASVGAKDITVTVDMINVVKSGKYSLPFSVSFSIDGIDIQKKSPQRCEITVDDVIVAEKEITPVVKGTPKNGYDIDSVTVTPNKVKITGPKTYVNKIQRAEAQIDVSGIQEDVRVNAPVVLYDYNGAKSDLSYISKNVDNASINCVVSNAKEVSIEPVLVSGSDTLSVTPIIESQNPVVIIGEADVINDINTIFTQPIDISGVKQADVVTAQLIIPDNVQIKNDITTVTIKFEVKENVNNEN